MDTEKLHQLADMIKSSNFTVFFGGAGVSTESGVPDFRSKNGIYSKHLGAESILTPGFMRHESEEFYRFYREYFMLKGIKPNACHRVLAEMEKRGQLKAVITQNVDGLHQDAGSEHVIELHGSGRHFYCTSCGASYTPEEVDEMPLVPKCTRCGALIRPDIVLYEEGLDHTAIRDAVTAISKADLLIIGGTSLTVYPAAGMIFYQKPSGKKVLINQSATGTDREAELVIRDPIAEVFAALEPLLEA